MTEGISYQAIQEAFITYLQDQEAAQDPKLYQQVPLPQAPKWIGTEGEAQAYNQVILDYRAQVQNLLSARNFADNQFDGAKRELKNILPNHQWFRVEHEGKTYFVGIETNDWGGGERHLRIFRASELENGADSLPELKHTTTSGN
jgi:hypothetical protein